MPAQLKRASKWIAQRPWPKQKLFLDLDCLEAFYGGAAGPGKSSALLMAALKYVEVPGYSALLLRRTYQDLSKPGALMDRAHEWLRGSGATWNEQKKQWTFPSGARLSFGYMETENDKYQYQGAEYQFVGCDETSQLTESQYTYLFSRLRRLQGSEIVIRCRAASNPGGIGAAWVKDRFIPDDFTPEMAIKPRVFWKTGEDGHTRAFVPARLEDNPALDYEEYVESLNQLDPVTREQLLKGDWQIRERGNVYPMWSDGIDGHHVITWSQFKEVFGVDHIPLHWLGSHGHDPGFDPDPRAAVWNFVAGENGPLAGDVFCVRELYANRMTVDDFADEVKQAEAPLSEASRIQVRLIGHEASSEQATLLQKHGLSYQKNRPDANGGISQMRHQLRITDDDLPHPFKPHLHGRPHFYVVVDDAELANARTARGMVNFRAEIASYRYIDASPSQQRGMPKVVPYDFFNHLMDAQRGVAARWFAMIAPLTRAEKLDLKLPESLQSKTVARIEDGAEKHRAAQTQDLWTRKLLADERAKRRRDTMPRIPTMPGRRR